MRSPSDVLQVTSDVFIGALRARPGFELPQRKVILTGDFAYDCPEFAVWTGQGMYPGFPGAGVISYQSATGGYVPLSMAVNVSILRNVPLVDNTGRLPQAETLTKSSLAIAEDGRALGEVFYDAWNNNTIAPYQDNLALTAVSFFGPQGGLAETRLTFTIQL